MIVVGIYIKNLSTLEYDRVELFADEKISVTSSIQNINDIGKTYTDFSQTFTVPATKNNNKIFKHWYENSLDTQFSTLIKADAYIELDTIPFRIGKIQLESCDIKENNVQSYSITFIGNLGNLKDKFAGLFLKDLDSTNYDFSYTGTIVKNKVVANTTSDDVMFPLISADRYWNYGATGVNDINSATYPIRYNELFPAIRLQSIFNMIENEFNVSFQGNFLTDGKFISAYLYLKNADTFNVIPNNNLITWDYINSGYSYGYNVNLANDSFSGDGTFCENQDSLIVLTPVTLGVEYNVHTFKNGNEIFKQTFVSETTSPRLIGLTLLAIGGYNPNDIYTVKISSLVPFTFNCRLVLRTNEFYEVFVEKNTSQTVGTSVILPINSYFPEIKIEDFFAGVLKMFNLTCFSSDGINYTIDTIENYYATGNIIDLTKYVKTDSINLTRVKTYKKINFLYEKSESLVNVGFLSNNGIDYGNLLYSTDNDGEEYSIKLPFEDLNFNNLKDKLQVGYALKTDLQKYIPKPIILYDYNPNDTTDLTDTTFYFSNALTGNGTPHTNYKAFGQEYFDETNTYSLNFNLQQSTLTNQVVDNSLYQTYYSNYISNIFNYRARLIKVSAILPISVLTSLKLNNRVIIRDKRYIINSFTTDLTTGEASFELLTDLRTL